MSETIQENGIANYELHYVVRFRVTDGKFYVDTDTANMLFSNGTVWTGSEWIMTDDPLEIYPLGALDQAAEKTLITLLDKGQEFAEWMKARKTV